MVPKRGRRSKIARLGEALAAALLAVVLSEPVGAQDRPREQPGTGSEPIALPELTVPGLLDQPHNPPTSTTGTKLDVPLRDVPQSIQVVPRNVIDEQLVPQRSGATIWWRKSRARRTLGRRSLVCSGGTMPERRERP